MRVKLVFALIHLYFFCYCFRLPECSRIDVINRGPHLKTTIASHCNDLFGLIKRSGKSCMTILADGGADFNVNHMTNEWFYMKLFRDLNLDVLIATSYCPGYSARNPIEHVWGVLTNAAVTVYLPDRLPGELPPTQQRLTKEALLAKEDQVFDAALRTLERYWADLKYGGVKIDVDHKSSQAPETPYTQEDKNTMHALLTGPYKNIKDAIHIHEEMEFFKIHVDRRVGMVLFTKCNSQDKCRHCEQNPINNIKAVDTYKRFPSPTPSPSHPGHFNTFLESLTIPQQSPDQHMPKVQEKNLGKCEDCRYMYTSESNKGDHRRLFHPKRAVNRR